ncbi:MAG: hypothetical protein AAF591_09965 [Verrucomicrobiota bacterium]
MAETKNTDENSRSQAEPKLTADQLCQELDRARHALASRSHDLGQQLNPAVRLRQSVTAHPGRWITLSAVGGLVAAQCLRSPNRRRHPKSDSTPANSPQRAGLPFAALLGVAARTAFKIAQPAATKLIQKRLNQLVD